MHTILSSGKDRQAFPLTFNDLLHFQEADKRKRIEKELEISFVEYRQLVETMNDGVVVIDLDGQIRYANKRFSDMLDYGCDEIVGQNPRDFFVNKDRTVFERRKERRPTSETSSYLTQLAGRGNRRIWVQVAPSLLFDQQGQAMGSMAVVTDVTSHVRLEQSLSDSANEIQDLYDNAPCGYHSIDRNGVFLRINRTESEWLGYAKDELIGKVNIVDLMTPESARAHQEQFHEFLNAGSIRDIERAFVRKDGTVFYGLLSASTVRDAEGNFVMSRATVYDITYRKQAEQALIESELAIRELTTQVMSAQEDERQRVASELHDGIGQTLSAIKFYVEDAITRLNKKNIEQSAQDFRNIVPKLQGAVAEVRRIAMDLRPSILDDIGILATLSWFTREFQSVYKSIHVDLQLSAKEGDIPAELKVMIFRIVQEAMNNCAKYSEADRLQVSLVKSEQGISLSLVDNGKGFDQEHVLAQKGKGMAGGMGLASMSKRAKLTGGAFCIDSAEGKGTSIRACWPSHHVDIQSIGGFLNISTRKCEEKSLDAVAD